VKARGLFLLMLLAGSRAPLVALEWKQTAVTLTPKPGADVVRARFEFTNASAKTVHIVDVATSCGCTDAAVTSTDVAPGATGSVFVLFTIGQRTGPQEKEITIRSDDAPEPTKLILKVILPAAAR